MKEKQIIQANLDEKLAIWLTNFNRSERLKEHIRMLDWVLNDGTIRDMRNIVEEANKNLRNS